MKKFVCLILASILFGCGGGGGGTDNGKSLSSISGTWIHDYTTQRMQVSLNSNDNINYTGSFAFYDYRKSPALYVKGNVTGSFNINGYFTSNTSGGVPDFITSKPILSNIETNITDLNISNLRLELDKVVNSSSNPNIPTTYGLHYYISIPSQLLPSYENTGTLEK